MSEDDRRQRFLNRRDFLRTAALGAGATGLGLALGSRIGMPVPWFGPTPGHAAGPSRSLDLLILGGTGFIGPHQVRYAVKRGHRVTVFNRGRSQIQLPDEVEELIGDRNDDLSALDGREWDVVIDNPTTLPNWVRLSGELLQHATQQYIFISTISVYADTSQVGRDEDTPLTPYQGEQDPFTLSVEDGSAHYGALKALSEEEVHRWFGNRATIIRPGLIVGPGDPTDRFTYWPVRIHRGGEILAPGTPEDPTQVIDARDLSEWTIRMAEEGRTGTYNATGPKSPRPLGRMLSEIRDALEADAQFTWVPQDFLMDQEVRGWSDMPVWVPLSEENAGFLAVSVERALAAGLTYRPFHETVRDTLTWFRSQPEDRQSQLRAGISPERELEVLQAWHRHAGPSSP